uniref:RIX1 domain-containing protein n=1 Tax=Rhodnius prolixus TaxID=13249 RepID=T1HFJ1_RHOPR
MNSTFHLLKLALGESDKYALRNYLQVCKDNILFQKDCNIESVVAIVNSSLNVSADFEKGVLILNVLLPQCKSDLIERNLLQWLQQCLKGLQSPSYLVTPYTLLRELIIYSKDYPVIRKQTSLNVIPKFLDHYFKNTKQLASEETSFNQTPPGFTSVFSAILFCLFIFFKLLLPMLQCLEQILLHYGKACGQWKNKIEQFLLQLLECPPAIVNACARCFLNLASIGPITADMGEIKQQWFDKQKFLISALHTILDRLFSHINEIQGTYETYIIRDDNNSSLPEISKTYSLKNVQRLTVQFTSLSEFLKIMFLGMFPVNKRVHPDAVFSVICRALSITCKTLEGNVSNDSIILSTQISTIHCACLNILDSLIQSCRRSLLPHAEIICKLLVQTLKWTKVDDCEFGQPVNPLANKEMCAAALSVLPPLLESTSFLIPSQIHKQLQERIVSELMQVETALRLSLDVPVPYRDETCRLALYTSLLALCNDPHPKFPAPCNYAVQIFTNGLNDSSLLVSRFCGQAVGNIDKIIHPLGPTLSFGLEVNEISTSTNINTTALGTTSEVVKVNGNLSTTGDIVSKEDCSPMNDSIVLESVPRLFENYPPKSPLNVEKKTENVINDKPGKEQMEIQPVEVVEMEIKSNENEIKQNECHSNQNSEKVKEPEIIEDIPNEMEKPKSKRRLNNDKDITIESPQEKKRKDDHQRQQETEVSELEKEMLSSFVDIVEVNL